MKKWACLSVSSHGSQKHLGLKSIMLVCITFSLFITYVCMYVYAGYGLVVQRRHFYFFLFCLNSAMI